MKRAISYSLAAFFLALALVSFNSFINQIPFNERVQAPSFAGAEMVKDVEGVPYISNIDFINSSYIFAISLLVAIAAYFSAKKSKVEWFHKSK